MVPDQEAIETFMSITGVDEATAIQKLEVVFWSVINGGSVLVLFIR